MHLSVLVPRSFSQGEKEELERFLLDVGFERGAGGWYRVRAAPGSLKLRCEADPATDPFWISCPLESLYFLPQEEIFLDSGEEPPVGSGPAALPGCWPEGSGGSSTTIGKTECSDQTARRSTAGARGGPSGRTRGTVEMSRSDEKRNGGHGQRMPRPPVPSFPFYGVSE
jgi:hypothetical protein